MKKIRVLIVDDSLVSQKLLKGILDSDPQIEVLAIAKNGIEAIEFASKLKPDVISMDINMPIMDGIEATRKIMSTNPRPIVIVSSIYNSSEIEAAIKELEAGAVSVLPKPFGPLHEKFIKSANKYRNTIKLMSEIKVVRRIFSEAKNPDIQRYPISFSNESSLIKSKIVVMGASAGGPESLRIILSNIDKNFPLPILVVQHIDKNFAEGFAKWLNTYSNIPVKIAENGEMIKEGNVYLAPGGKHMIAKEGGYIEINNDNIGSVHKPSIDHLFKSVNKVYGSNAVGILLSGMGKDGAIELKNLKNSGAYTYVQDEKSSLVFGMPAEAVKIDAACKISTPKEIVIELNYLKKNI